jgi:ApaG protein
MGETSSEAATRGIRVVAKSRYEPERSAPDQGHFHFSYRIRIENRGERAATLLSRRWLVTNDRGEIQQIEGPGVVGETPTLEPGQGFEYESFCLLETPVGIMEGHYVMELAGGGDRFEARIAPFTLAVPGALN